MAYKRLGKKFYNRDTKKVAKDILGKYLVRKWKNKIFKGKIVETEAYIGLEDKASHVYGGKKTKRSKVVYLDGGHVYIYLCYGIHWQLNITTNSENPECILIRALEPTTSEQLKSNKKLTDGPGKLTKWMKLNKSFNREDLTKSKKIWVERGRKKSKKSQIISTKRIGIDYAEEWAEKRLRFYIKNNPFVSNK